MKKLFTIATSLLIAGTMNLIAEDINVDSGTALATAYKNASAGDVLILADGDYDAGEKGVSLNIDKDITFKAANPGKANLLKYQFVLPAGASVDNLTFDGIIASYDETTDSKYFLQVNAETSVLKNLTLKNSTFYNYSRGIVRGTTAKAKLTNTVIDNCIFYQISNIDAGAGYAIINPQKTISSAYTIKNSTFYSSKGCIFRHGEGNTDPVVFSMENCTVIKCGEPTNARNMIEINAAVVAGSSFTVKNCIFSRNYTESTPLESVYTDGVLTTDYDKSIMLQGKGTINNCLLESFSTPLVAAVDMASVTSPVEAAVTSYNFAELTMDTTPTTISAIGDPRWKLNGATNIFTPVTTKTIKSVKYFDLLGKQISEDAQGIVIVKKIYEDGSVSSEKVFK